MAGRRCEPNGSPGRTKEVAIYCIVGVVVYTAFDIYLGIYGGWAFAVPLLVFHAAGFGIGVTMCKKAKSDEKNYIIAFFVISALRFVVEATVLAVFWIISVSALEKIGGLKGCPAGHKGTFKAGLSHDMTCSTITSLRILFVVATMIALPIYIFCIASMICRYRCPKEAPPPTQPQATPRQGFPGQGYPPQGYPPQGYPPQAQANTSRFQYPPAQQPPQIFDNTTNNSPNM